MNKIVTYVLAALLVAALAGAAVFYVTMFEPMSTDYRRMKDGMPALDKAKSELAKYKEKESREAGWIAPAVTELSKHLDEEIKAGTAEISAAGSAIVINLAEDALFQSHSVTFKNESRALLQKMAAMLAVKEVKGKQIMVANTTDGVAGQGKGRKKILPKEARVLASERSLQIVKFLEQNKVDREALAAAAYAEKTPDTGFKIKDHKTILVIANPPSPAAAAAAAKSIPVKPAEPK